MPSIPSKLQIGTTTDDAYALINNNFDGIIQNVRDLGANVSTTGTFTAVIPATSLTTLTFTLTSQSLISNSVNQVFTLKPVSAVTGITPLVDIYVDTDNDVNYLAPVGSNLNGSQRKLLVSVIVSSSSFTNSLGAWTIQVNNRDASTHTYYIHTNCGYFPTPASGIFR